MRQLGRMDLPTLPVIGLSGCSLCVNDPVQTVASMSGTLKAVQCSIVTAAQ